MVSDPLRQVVGLCSLTRECDSPGRFFVAHELKMLIAYLFLNYDLRRMEERPPPSCIGRTMIPPTTATMELKRKAATGVAS